MQGPFGGHVVRDVRRPPEEVRPLAARPQHGGVEVAPEDTRPVPRDGPGAAPEDASGVQVVLEELVAPEEVDRPVGPGQRRVDVVVEQAGPVPRDLLRGLDGAGRQVVARVPGPPEEVRGGVRGPEQARPTFATLAERKRPATSSRPAHDVAAPAGSSRPAWAEPVGPRVSPASGPGDDRPGEGRPRHGQDAPPVRQAVRRDSPQWTRSPGRCSRSATRLWSRRRVVGPASGGPPRSRSRAASEIGWNCSAVRDVVVDVLQLGQDLVADPDRSTQRAAGGCQVDRARARADSTGRSHPAGPSTGRPPGPAWRRRSTGPGRSAPPRRASAGARRPGW